MAKLEEVPAAERAQHLVQCLRAVPVCSERIELLAAPEGRASFLAHACEMVPFYRSLFGGKVPELRDFPLLNRRKVVLHRDELLADNERKSPFYFETSGSTGEPLRVTHDLASWYQFSIGVYSEVARSIPGLLEAVSPGRTGVVIVSNKEQPRNSAVLVPLRSSLLRILVVGRDDEEDRSVIQDLRADPPPLLYGKSLYLLDLAELNSRIYPSGRIRPGAILVSGENLFERYRRELERWFDCKVYNAYISTEGGLIAMECPHRSGLHICNHRITLELLGEDGLLRSEGSGEVVLTNFMNWALPIIRYQTGDLATIRRMDCPCGYQGLTIVELPGREATFLRSAGGEGVNPSSLDAIFESLPVQQFQVCQKNGEYRVRWIPAPSCSPEEVGEIIKAAVLECLGRAPIEVTAVEKITAKGGKIRRYLRESECLDHLR